MTPKIINVKAKPKYKLQVKFKGKSDRLFDVKPLLNKGVFKELRNNNYFKKVRLVWGGVEWPHQQDLSADTLYARSVPVKAPRRKPAAKKD